MQTFIPIASTDFMESAKVLDNKRLNKQALEGWQIMMTLLELDPEGNHRTPKGWVNHPAVLMWKGHESLLWVYVLSMVKEWKARGYNSTIGDKATQTMDAALTLNRITKMGALPAWMRDKDKFEAIAASHRTALLTKEYEWYSQFEWQEDTGVAPTHYDYIWR